MAVKISIDSLVNYGAAGSPFGSEVLFVAATGPNYITRTSVSLLSRVLPSHMWVIVPAGQSVDVQYTADSGATWRSMLMGTATYIYADTGGSIRIFNSTPGNVDIRFVPDRASN